MRKSVHIIGAGGPAGIGMTRCLKDWYDLVGKDSSVWGMKMMETGDDQGADASAEIPVSDASVSHYNAVQYKMFLPPKKQVELCRDKAKCAEVLGSLAPKTYWVRDTEGAGGKGSQMASEILPGHNHSQEYVYFEGRMLATFQKRRISYQVKKRTSGLENVGSSAVSVCTDDMGVAKVTREALNAVSKATGTVLHGFYGVDTAKDADGIPKVTEINAGRLLTASYSFFWLTGYNLPLVGIKAYLGEEAPLLPDYPLGYGIIRQADQLPRLIPPEITKNWL